MATAIPSLAGKVSVEEAQSELLLVKVHADWCGSCKALESRLITITETLKEQPVLFGTLDYTDKKTSFQATLHASILGISGAIASNKGTGTVLLINAKNQKMLEKFSTANTDDEIVGKITAKL